MVEFIAQVLQREEPKLKENLTNSSSRAMKWQSSYIYQQPSPTLYRHKSNKSVHPDEQAQCPR